MRDAIVNQSASRLKAIAMVICVLATAAAAFIVVGPNRAGAASSETQDVEEARAAFDAVRVQRAQLAQRLNDMRNAGGDDDRIRLRPASDSNRTLSALHKSAAELGLEIDEVVVAAPIAQPTHSEVPIHIEARGSFASMLGFFRRIASDCSDVVVRELDLSGNVHDESSVVTLSLDLAWYAEPVPTD